MMRAALYARVSLEDQAEQFGLPSQLRAVREYARTKKYGTPDELVFVDDGYLGADLDRPALERLRAAVKARAVDVVIAHDPDRLSRKLAHLVILQDECERYGVRLEFVTTPAAENAEGRMFLSLKGVFAEYEREKIRERTLRGRREKARQGFVVGGRVPFGYSYLGKAEGERGRLVIDEAEAAIVRDIFAWAQEGASIREIVTKLNMLGVKPKYGARWGKSSVFRLLKNETYIGTAYYNRRQRSEPAEMTEQHRRRRNKKTLLRMRPESEWIALAAPAIVTREAFDLVAERLRRNLEVRSGRPSTTYLLRGLCWCGLCKRRMQGCPSHGLRYYRCSGRDRLAVDRCAAARVHAGKLERSVWRAITDAFRDPAALRAIIERNLERFRPSDVADVSREDAIKRQVEQLRRREFRAAQALLDADLGDHYDLFKRQLSEARNQRTNLEAELRSIARGRDAAASAITNAEAVCRSIRRALANADESQKQGFLQRIVERVNVTGTEAEIVCAIPQSATQNCSDRENVVTARGRDLERALRRRLAADLAKVGEGGIVDRSLEFRLRRR